MTTTPGISADTAKSGIPYRPLVFATQKIESKTLPTIPDKPDIGGGGFALATYDPNAALPDWDMQVPVWPLKVNQGFKQYHTGIDLECAYREPIYAVQSGKVVYSGWIRGYGLTAEIWHANGLLTRYAHLSESFVKTQDIAKMGQIIGSCGATGRATGTHLHFEIIHEGQWLNPTSYLFD